MEKIRSALTGVFALATLGGVSGAAYCLDKSHPHGFTNPYHETVDTVSETGTATEAQKDELVKAAMLSTEYTDKGNIFSVIALLGFGGFMATSNADRLGFKSSKPRK